MITSFDTLRFLLIGDFKG